MKRIFALILAIMLLTLTACGGEQPADTTATVAPETEGTKAPIQLNIPNVYQKLQQEVVLPEMLELNPGMMLDFCGINDADVKQAIVVICADSLRADEIWLVEAVDAEAAARIKGLAETRLEQKDAESVTYSPEQNAVVKQAELICIDNYIALLVSPDSKELARIFNEQVQ